MEKLTKDALFLVSLELNDVEKIPETLPDSLLGIWLSDDEIEIPEKYKNLINID